MEDVVLDTNALRLLLLINYVNKILEVGDEIFVCKEWKREYGGIKDIQLGFNTFIDSVKRLKKMNKFHEKTGDSTTLPVPLKRALEEYGADDVDLKVACVACNRSGSGQIIFLVSNDYPFNRAQPHFERYNINVERREAELNRVGL